MRKKNGPWSPVSDDFNDLRHLSIEKWSIMLIYFPISGNDFCTTRAKTSTISYSNLYFYFCLVSRPICQTEWQRGSGYTGQVVGQVEAHMTRYLPYWFLCPLLLRDISNVTKTPWRHSSPTASCKGTYITPAFHICLQHHSLRGNMGFGCCVSNSYEKQGWFVCKFVTFRATSSESENVYQYTREGCNIVLDMPLILLYL